MKSKYSNFIKLFVSVLVISSALFIQSCSNSETENLSDQISQSAIPQNSVFKVYDKTYKTPEGLQIWEAQLNKTIEMDTNMVRDGLKLIRYEYVRQIASTTDLETVKTELKKDNSSFIAYKNNSSRFSVRENKKFAKSYSNLIDSLLPTSAGILKAIRAKGDSLLLAKAAYEFKKNDIGVVNLVWEYKGKTLNTQCLVSNEKGIIYDKFLFSIHTTVCKITSTRSNFSKAPQDNPEEWTSVGQEVGVSYQVYNVYGDIMIDFGIRAAIYGVKYNGRCFINQAPSVSNWAKSVCPDVYTCAAYCKILSFSPYSDSDGGHLKIEYAIIGGYNVNILFDENNFPIFIDDWTGGQYLHYSVWQNGYYYYLNHAWEDGRSFYVDHVFDAGNLTLTADQMQ